MFTTVEDSDIDGDGLPNEKDEDLDGDGKANHGKSLVMQFLIFNTFLIIDFCRGRGH